MLRHVQLFVTPWTVTPQDPVSVEFSRQKYWSEFPFPTIGVLPNPGIEPASPVSPALAGEFFTTKEGHMGSPFFRVDSCLIWLVYFNDEGIRTPWVTLGFRVHRGTGTKWLPASQGQRLWKKPNLPTPCFWTSAFTTVKKEIFVI